MQKSVFTLFSIMLLSLSVEANINVTLQPEDSSRLFSQIETLPEADKSSQALALIQESALRSLLMSPTGSTTSASKKTIFEKALRSGVRSNLVAMPIFQPNTLTSNVQVDRIEVDLQWDKTRLEQVIERLTVLDKELSKYVRMSTSKNEFNQLKKLMPALYNIEERRALLQLLKINKMPAPQLKNSRLVGFLDKRISRMAGDLKFNMKALLREGAEYETDLIASMEQQALTFTAKPPDFVLDYKFASAGQDKTTGNWLFYGKIALLDRFKIQIASAEIEMSEGADSAEQAQPQALDKLAEALSQNLRAVLLEKR